MNYNVIVTNPIVIDVEVSQEIETFYPGDLVYFKVTGCNSGYFTKKVIKGQTPSLVLQPPTADYKFTRVRWGSIDQEEQYEQYNPEQLELDFRGENV
jgi:hypothetical protein